MVGGKAAGKKKALRGARNTMQHGNKIRERAMRYERQSAGEITSQDKG